MSHLSHYCFVFLLEQLHTQSNTRNFFSMWNKVSILSYFAFPSPPNNRIDTIIFAKSQRVVSEIQRLPFNPKSHVLGARPPENRLSSSSHQCPNLPFEGNFLPIITMEIIHTSEASLALLPQYYYFSLCLEALPDLKNSSS